WVVLAMPGCWRRGYLARGWMTRPCASARRWLSSRAAYVRTHIPRVSGCGPAALTRPVSGCPATDLAAAPSRPRPITASGTRSWGNPTPALAAAGLPTNDAVYRDRCGEEHTAGARARCAVRRTDGQGRRW